MRRCGLQESWGFGEVYGFDEDLLAFIPQPCLAVIVNAEFLKKSTDRVRGDMAVPSQFYMKQTEVLDNACGVIACIHSILNNVAEGKISLQEGTILANFHNQTKDASAAERATILENFTEF